MQDPDRSTLVRAAAAIYVNRTCFNGLYRVNKAGKFNTPRQQKAPKLGGIADRIMECSDALQSATLTCGGFRTALLHVYPGDFVYLDPPYTPASATANFTSYTAGGFSWEDHVALADLVVQLKQRGARVLLSNAALPHTVDLYQSRGLKVEVVESPRRINCKAGERGNVSELLVS
jgi:DNA adenine methylase